VNETLSHAYQFEPLQYIIYGCMCAKIVEQAHTES